MTSLGKTAFDWEAYKGRLEVLKSMLNDPDQTDTLLVTDDGSEYPVNATVMSVLGEKFSKTMYNQINNQKAQSVEVIIGGGKISCRKVLIKKTTSDAMESLVNSCYTGLLTMNKETVWKVMKAAEYYEMTFIIQGCCEFLSQFVDETNCLQMYLVAKKKDNPKLLTKSLLTIEKHFKNIANNNLFFSTIDSNHLNALLSDDFLNVNDETIVWLAIKRWITLDEVNRISHLQKLIGNIRYHRAPIEILQQLVKDPLIVKAGAIPRMQKILDLVTAAKRSKKFKNDGNMYPVGHTPVTIRPRIPKTVLFASGGWKTGQTCALIETYDYMTNQWFRVPNPEQGPKKAYHGIEILHYKMYIIGGTNGNEILDTVHVYDPVANTWISRKSLGTKRCYVATAILNGKIYAMGGHNGEFRMRSAEVYDPDKDEWTPISDMIIARSDGAAASLNGHIYVAGGLNEGSIEASLESYDPVKDEWTILRRMSSPRTSLAVAVFNGYIFAIGGNSGTARLASAEKYDPLTNTWTVIPDMIQKRSTFKAAVVDGKIYVCGGYNGSHPITRCEVFDPETDTWKEIAGLSAPRSGLAVVAMDELPNIKKLTFYGYSKQ